MTAVESGQAWQTAASSAAKPRCGRTVFWIQSHPMHLRMPAIDQGVKAFLWALFFFLYLWLGMLAIAVSQGTAFLLSAIAGLLIFLFVRVRGEDDLGPPDAAVRPPAIP